VLYEKDGDRCFVKASSGRVEVLGDLVGFLTSVDDIKPDPSNPRKTKMLDRLVAGIRRYGVRWPIIVNKRNNVIEAGHQRLYALQELGIKHVPVIWADDDGATAAGFNISDNRLGEIVSVWDKDALGKMLEGLLKEDSDVMDGIGFSEKEVNEVITRMLDKQDGGTSDGNDDINENVKGVSSLGDIWKLGPHRLICGDSTDPGVMSQLMDGEKARMVFTDPPYNVDYSDDRKIENDNLGNEFKPFLLAAIRNMTSHCEGAMYICMSSSELDVLQSSFREAGGHWSTFIIWAKDRFTIGRSDYQRQYEPILYGWPDGAADRHWCGARDQGDVWFFDKPGRNPVHPTMKPVELVEKAIKNSSVRGDLVIDSFLGSGTTMMAAEKTGRRCNGIELDPHYCDVICDRYFNMSGVSPVRVSDGAEWSELASDE